MARILCNVAGGGKPLKGNAETGDVLAGKTFSNKQSNALTGSMPNQGGHQSSTGVGGGSGSLYAYMPYGYYGNYNNSGNAWIDITDDQAKTLANNAGVGYNSGYYNGYSKGVSDADARVNTSSASYNSGYTNGHAAPKSKTLTISLSMWSSHNDEGTHWHADVSVNGSHVCGAEQGGATGYYTVTL